MLVKSTNNEEFENFQLKFFLLYHHFFKENKTMHLQLYLLFLDNNQFENHSEIAFGPNRPDKSSNSLYSEVDKVYYC